MMKRVVVVTWLALILGLASHPAAQSAVTPKFEVASVKPSASDPLAFPRSSPPAPGRFTMLDVSLRLLVVLAYGDRLSDFQIIGGPDWLNSRRFDIQAKAEDAAASRDAMLPMLKALLEERFQLKAHTEMREMPIFALVAARDDRRLGTNIRPSATDCSDPELVKKMWASGPTDRGMPCVIWPMPARVAGSEAWRGNGVSMVALTEFLKRPAGRFVQDRTGMSGFYDFEMTYARVTRGATTTAASTSESPELTTALQEQLGLKLESTRGPVEVLVIDSAALPEPD
jgi:uncharacterized protein (TIGR03435 family)